MWNNSLVSIVFTKLKCEAQQMEALLYPLHKSWTKIIKSKAFRIFLFWLFVDSTLISVHIVNI